MCTDKPCDFRVNPFETIKSWPATLTAVCVNCNATRQLGSRGWTLVRTPVQNWPKVKFDEARVPDPRQLKIG